jgi:hypothetical protein
MAALAPMPSASVTTTVTARPLARHSARAPTLTSWARAAAWSAQRLYQTRRIASRAAGT